MSQVGNNLGHQNTQRKGYDRLRDDPDALITERIAMTGGYENPVQEQPSGKGDFWFESYDPNIGSFYSDNAEELAGRPFLNLGAVCEGVGNQSHDTQGLPRGRSREKHQYEIPERLCSGPSPI